MTKTDWKQIEKVVKWTIVAIIITLGIMLLETAIKNPDMPFEFGRMNW